VLAYISWHRAAAGVQASAYEQALAHFHRSLSGRPPSGFHGSATFRLPELPWLAPVADGSVKSSGETASSAYEDWYLVADWAAVGVLEEAAVARGRETVHHAIASLAGVATSSVYRLVEGQPRPSTVADAVWVSPARGHEYPSLGALLGDGIDPARDSLWRRCLGLGPAPEYCLLAAEAPAGVAPSRLPAGWVVKSLKREVLWNG
jgi:hypothetical protein